MILELQRQLGIDASFFTQLLIFLVVFTWMQVVYFKPFLKLIQKRQGSSGGLTEEATKLEEAAARDEQEAAVAEAATRKKAAAERERILAEARAQANEVVGAARASAKTKLEQAREAAIKNAESELAGLRSQVSGVAGMLVEKLTKTKVGL